MNLRELELFGTLMRVGTTIETAAVLGISQPGVSAQIKRIEARLRLTLFQRVGNRLEPTAEAHALFAQAAPIFTTQAEIRSRIEELASAARAPVTISATPAIVEGFLAERLATAGYDNWRKHLRLWVTEPETDVRSGRADIGLQMAVPAKADFHAETLMEVALGAVMRRDHPLASKDRLSITDIAAEPLVSYDPAWSPMGAVIQQAFRAKGLKYNLSCEAPFCSTVCHLVEACGGVGVIDALTAGRLTSPALVWKPLGNVPTVPLIVFHRRKEPLRSAVLSLLTLLKTPPASKGKEKSAHSE
ncbi:LysR family transcriptional regulator [Rhizobium sp. S95]|uniref:LysR family transcriptional regulator n=1 Tax=Ciceribacter sichuanensis TaxID=2949647 RepID=A0AAJ1BZR2_9HYPH|nr:MULTISPECIES: LysR family transcriptional regulator [unclassified Ciceribacter]MCM2397445.1 LysR family transcriptional regulator [Ciceribacter sp. S95]MCO5959161.1 LysR family transcriptional regulator [Ciceribacter sp. S101]